MRSRSKVRVAKRRAPSTSRSKSVARKLTYSRRSYAGPSQVIVAPSVGLGQSARTVLQTEFYSNLTPAASGIFTGYLKPGSAFDPTGDLAAIQPALYDQWAATYGRYVVEKATVIIELCAGFVQAGGGSYYALLAAAYPSISATALATYQAAASQPFSRTALINPFTDNTNSNRLVFKLDHAKVLGRKGQVTAEDNGALTSADPTTGEFMVLPIFLQWAQASTSAVTVRVRILQTVYFDRRINVVDA